MEKGDGNNRNWMWGMVIPEQNIGNPQGTGSTRYQFSLLQRFGMVEGSAMAFTVFTASP
jgi:hypothetical protein